MQHRILFQPSEALIEVTLAENEEIQAEAGAMVFMSWNVDVQTSAKGGMLSAFTKSAFGGESFFTNKYRSTQGHGLIGFCAPFPGDIKHYHLENQTMFIQSGSYVCSSTSITTDTKWAGAKGFFGGSGLFMLKASGTGDLFVNSFGAIYEKQLNNDKFIVDTGHVVGFTEGLTYNVKRIGGLKSTLFSGEGLVAEFNGTGTLWIQTRNPNAFFSWIAPHMPKSN